MAHTDVQAVGAVDQFQEAQHVGHVVQRLADAHEDDVGDGHAAVQLGEQHLVQQLRGAQVADLAGDGAGAEGAAHAAAHLRRDADGVAVVVTHEDALDAVAVGQLPEVFDGAVQPGDLLPGHGGGGDEALLRQLGTQGLGEVCHVVEGRDAPVQPGEYLPGAEGGLAQGIKISGQFRFRHGFDVGHSYSSLRRRIRQIKKPSVPVRWG